MKEEAKNSFYEYKQSLTESELGLISDFFAEFDSHCLLAKKEKQKIRTDFERAILYYVSSGTLLEEALLRLNAEHLGGFYTRPAILWFPLDAAAKIYPISMNKERMALFRLSVYLKKDVVPELLQMALTFTIKRFPSFATTLKKGFFWHYLDTAKRRFCIEEENDIPCSPIKVSASGSQSFRVLYYKNRISVEFFHVLTDGVGGMTFLKVLTAEYLRLCGVKADRETGSDLWNIDDIPHSDEFANEFSRVPHSENASGFMGKAAVQMNGKLSKQRPCRIIHFKMDTEELKAAAARYNCTVTVYMLALMFIAQKAATDELEGEASIQVPVNMRKYYPSVTVRNFAMYFGVRLPLDEITDAPSIIGEISRQLTAKGSKEAMSEMVTASYKLVHTLRFIPLVIKQPVAKMVYGFLGDKIFSTTLSNLGLVKMPAAYSEHIDSMDFVLGTAITNRAPCAMVSFGNTATLSVSKLTVDPSFEERLYKLLCDDGITVRVEGSELYED